MNNQISQLNDFFHRLMINNLHNHKQLNVILLRNLNKDVIESAFRLKIMQMKIGVLLEQVFVIFGNCEKLTYNKNVDKI